MVRLISCRKCCGEFIENNIRDHHIVPKYTFPEFWINGKFNEIKYKEGKILLCWRCHDFIHQVILKFGFPKTFWWSKLNEKEKRDRRRKIKHITLRLVNG